MQLWPLVFLVWGFALLLGLSFFCERAALLLLFLFYGSAMIYVMIVWPVMELLK